ncbi:unnamed protein product, partial [Thlaspi arvense]
MGTRGNRVGERWNEMGCEEKSSVIQEEIKRVCKLPSNSVYAVHRLKVLSKINELLSAQNIVAREGVRVALHTALSVKLIGSSMAFYEWQSKTTNYFLKKLDVCL